MKLGSILDFTSVASWKYIVLSWSPYCVCIKPNRRPSPLLVIKLVIVPNIQCAVGQGSGGGPGLLF